METHMNKLLSSKICIRAFLFALGSLIVACGSAPVGSPNTITMTYGGSQLYPSYEVTFRADGTAKFVSEVVPNERRTLPDNIAERERSRFTGKISPDQLVHLKDVLSESGFSAMSADHNPSTGGNQTTIEVEFGQEKKVVTSQHGSKGPNFDSLENVIELLIDQIEWTNDSR